MEMTLYLDLVLNGFDTGGVEPILAKGERFFLAASVLRALGLGAHLPTGGEGPVALGAIDGMHTRYDSAAQKLFLTVPANWLPMQRFVQDKLTEEKKARASFGAITNYDAYATQANGLANLSLWSEQRIFGPFGTISNTGAPNSHSRATTVTAKAVLRTAITTQRGDIRIRIG